MAQPRRESRTRLRVVVVESNAASQKSVLSPNKSMTRPKAILRTGSNPYRWFSNTTAPAPSRPGTMKVRKTSALQRELRDQELSAAFNGKSTGDLTKGDSPRLPPWFTLQSSP